MSPASHRTLAAAAAYAALLVVIPVTCMVLRRLGLPDWVTLLAANVAAAQLCETAARPIRSMGVTPSALALAVACLGSLAVVQALVRGVPTLGVPFAEVTGGGLPALQGLWLMAAVAASTVTACRWCGSRARAAGPR